MPFTKEQIQKHIEDPWTCPFCGAGSEHIDGDPYGDVPQTQTRYDDIDGHELMGYKRCNTCNTSWRDYYKLHDIEEEDADGCAISNEEGGT
jgi:hypothetical protein